MIPERGLTLAEIGAMVGSMHGDEPWRYTARLSQIKYLQRQGVAPSRAVGRGVKGTYPPRDVWLIIFASELQAVGLTPTQIDPIVQAHGDRFIGQVKRGDPMTIEMPVHNRFVHLTLDGERIGAAARHYLKSLPAPKPRPLPMRPVMPAGAGNTVDADDHRRIKGTTSFLKH